MISKSLPAEDPLQPSFGVVATLQSDLLHFLNELKFLMLFFDKPVGMMTNVGFNYLSKEAVQELKKGRNPSTNAFDEENSALKNVQAIFTEDWESIEQHCEIDYANLKFNFEDNAKDESINQIDSVKGLPLSEFTWEKLNYAFNKGNLSTKEKDIVFGAMLLRLQMSVFRDSLDKAVRSGRTLVWEGDTARQICNIYIKHLLAELAAEDSARSVHASASLARSLGTSVLRDMFSCNTFNLLSVPPHRIAQFRQNNKDLLISFQDEYWDFVNQIKNSPNEMEICKERFQSKMRKSLQSLEGEIRAIRRKTGYEWLRRIGDDVYRYALTGTGVAATLSWLASPSLILAPAGAFIVAQAAKAGTDFLSRREQIENTLEKSSFGYIWQAQQKFGKS